MDDGKHDILPVAGAILDHARMPVTLPRQSDADMRRDGSTTAQTVPNLPSMSAEECTAPQDSHTGIGSTRWLNSQRTLSQNRASPDTVESRRRRWPEREKRPRLRRQDKSAASGRAHGVGRIGDSCHPGHATCWRFGKKQKRIQRSYRHPPLRSVAIRP
jgi:hypothetical protein